LRLRIISAGRLADDVQGQVLDSSIKTNKKQDKTESGVSLNENPKKKVPTYSGAISMVEGPPAAKEPTFSRKILRCLVWMLWYDLRAEK